MQITCPNCRKIFLVKDELISTDGRQLQCGKCFNQWFFKKTSSKDPSEIKKIDNDYKLSKTSTIQNVEKIKKTKTKEFNFDQEKEEFEEKKELKEKKKNINIFKLILLIIITFASIIIVIETFKKPISIFYPDIITILNNLFLTLEDIKLFIKDLVK